MSKFEKGEFVSLNGYGRYEVIRVEGERRLIKDCSNGKQLMTLADNLISIADINYKKLMVAIGNLKYELNALKDREYPKDVTPLEEITQVLNEAFDKLKI